jgi:hypothetical protein
MQLRFAVKDGSKHERCPTHGVPLVSSPYDADEAEEKDFCPQCEIEWETTWATKGKGHLR